MDKEEQKRRAEHEKKYGTEKMKTGSREKKEKKDKTGKKLQKQDIRRDKEE